jgi:hypothetical protein
MRNASPMQQGQAGFRLIRRSRQQPLRRSFPDCARVTPQPELAVRRQVAGKRANRGCAGKTNLLKLRGHLITFDF